jgi:hypothetical protein
MYGIAVVVMIMSFTPGWAARDGPGALECPQVLILIGLDMHGVDVQPVGSTRATFDAVFQNNPGGSPFGDTWSRSVIGRSAHTLYERCNIRVHAYMRVGGYVLLLTCSEAGFRCIQCHDLDRGWENIGSIGRGSSGPTMAEDGSARRQSRGERRCSRFLALNRVAKGKGPLQ